MKTKYVNANVIGIVCVLTVCAARVGYAQDSKDRCSLLTQGAVSAAAGVSVRRRQAIARQAHVAVGKATRHRHGDVPGPAMNAVFTKETPGVATRTHLGGIGEDAVYVSAGSMASLWVKHQKDILLVRVYGVRTRTSRSRS